MSSRISPILIAVSSNPCNGTKYHAVSKADISVKQIAEMIGEKLNIPIVSLSPEEGKSHFGWLAAPVAMNAPALNAITKQSLEWQPKQPFEFIDDLNHSSEFYS